MSTSKKKKLTIKQELFICEYCNNGFNATQAAISAGYSKKTAKEMGAENLTKPHIAVEVDKRKKKFLAKAYDQYEVSDERIIREMSLLAFSNKADYFDSDGRLKPIHKLTRDQAAAITEVTQKSFGKDGEILSQTYKIADKKTMLDMLAKYKKLYSEDDEAGKTKHELPTINITFPSNGR